MQVRDVEVAQLRLRPLDEIANQLHQLVLEPLIPVARKLVAGDAQILQFRAVLKFFGDADQLWQFYIAPSYIQIHQVWILAQNVNDVLYS